MGSQKKRIEPLITEEKKFDQIGHAVLELSSIEKLLTGVVGGEYSCRCHGKRVISALSKPLKLKLAGHIL